MTFSTPVKYVKGVGPARAAVLETKGILTAEDLVAYAPFRYEDRTNLKSIAQLAPGEMATVIATVHSAELVGFKRRQLGMFEAAFTDSSRAVLAAKWFHAAYLADLIQPGRRIALYGKVEWDSYSGGLTMLHPEFEMLSGDFGALTGPSWDLRMAEAKEMQNRLCRLNTEPYRRWSAGFSCLFFVWVGAPMAIWLRNKDFLTSFFLCFSPILAVYYPLMAYGIDGAKNGTIPPISVWAGNVVLLAAGAWLLRRVLRY